MSASILSISTFTLLLSGLSLNTAWTIPSTSSVQAVFKLNPENNNVEVDIDKIEADIRKLTKAVAIQALNRH